jgi:hypothetical protein
MTKSYQDPVKQKAREKLREFIKSNLLSIKRPEDVKVVCFPGAEQDGQEALEVKEVYDPLGIPRQNITGLEYLSQNAARLRRANLGIEVVESDALNYFLKNQRKFDVISLDYTGQQTLREATTLECIASREFLDKRGILLTNFIGKREGDQMQEILARRLHSRLMDENNYLKEFGAKKSQIIYEEDINGFKSANTLDQLRNAITVETAMIFMGGLINFPVGLHMFSRDPKKDTVLNSLNENGGLVNEGIYDIDNLFDKEIAEEQRRIELEKAYYSYRVQEMFPILSPIVGRVGATSIINILQATVARPYLVSFMERYKYTGNNGSPMLMDLFSFKPFPYKTIDKLRSLIVYNPSDSSVVINPLGVSHDKFKKQLLSAIKEYLPYGHIAFDGRVDLGSSYVPQKRKERITKEQAIDLLRSGVDPVDIVECYGGFSKMQLAAYKARYVTVGKFGKAPDQ